MMQQDEEPLDPQAERLAIRKRAMDMLARREHAPAELADKLAKRDHDREQISSVLDELIDEGLLSQTRYADAMVASRAARGVGPVRIRAELAAVRARSTFSLETAYLAALAAHLRSLRTARRRATARAPKA